MKFKDFLHEKTHERIFYFMSEGYIPLTPKMLERHFVIKKANLFHVTDIFNIPYLEKLQKTRKQISCFTKFTKNKIFRGAEGLETPYPCTFVLKGSYTFGGSEDIYTKYDKGGRRWVQPSRIVDSIYRTLFSEISDYMFSEFEKSKDLEDYSEYEIMDMLWHPNKISGKIKSTIIKAYMDASEKALAKYKKEITDAFEEETSSYNEVMGYDFVIKEKIIDTDTAVAFLFDEEGRDEEEIIDRETGHFTKEALEFYKKQGIQVFIDIEDIADYLDSL